MPAMHSRSTTSIPFLAGPPRAETVLAHAHVAPPPPAQMPATPVGWLCFYLVCAWLVIMSVRQTARIYRMVRAYRRRKAAPPPYFVASQLRDAVARGRERSSN